MRNKIVLFVLATFLVAGFGFAAQTTPNKSVSAKASAAAEMPMMSGTIEKVNTTAHTVTVNLPNGTKTFSLGSKTVYVVNGRQFKHAKLSAGEKIDLYADSHDNARRIEIERSH
jgi:hypothetical protein